MSEESTEERVKLSKVNDVMVENLIESHLRKSDAATSTSRETISK